MEKECYQLVDFIILRVMSSLDAPEKWMVPQKHWSEKF